MIAKRTRAKNTARALLRSAGIRPPKNPGLWTKKGLAWLRQLALPTPSQQLRRDLLLEEIEGLIRQVRRVEQHLNRQAQQTPAVALLRTIPGVDIRLLDLLPDRYHVAVGLLDCLPQTLALSSHGLQSLPVLPQFLADLLGLLLDVPYSLLAFLNVFTAAPEWKQLYWRCFPCNGFRLPCQFSRPRTTLPVLSFAFRL